MKALWTYLTDKERLLSFLFFATVINLIILFTWFEALQLFDWGFAALVTYQTALFSCAIYVASAFRVFLLREKVSWPRGLLLSLLIIGAITLCFFSLEWMNAIVLRAIPIDPRAVAILQAFHSPSCSEEHAWWWEYLFSMHLSLIFCLMGWAYERSRTKLNRAMQQLRTKELREQSLKAKNTQAELQALQARINPSFLFDTIDAITAQLKVHPRDAEESVLRLSQLFRAMLKTSLSGTTTLSECLEQSHTFLHLEELRRGHKLHWNISITGNTRNIVLPDLVLLPLLENALKNEPLEQEIRLQLDVFVGQQETLVSLFWQLEHSSTASIGLLRDGLSDIHRRLELSYGRQASIDIQVYDGHKITLRIPVGE